MNGFIKGLQFTIDKSKYWVARLWKILLQTVRWSLLDELNASIKRQSKFNDRGISTNWQPKSYS